MAFVKGKIGMDQMANRTDGVTPGTVVAIQDQLDLLESQMAGMEQMAKQDRQVIQGMLDLMDNQVPTVKQVFLGLKEIQALRDHLEPTVPMDKTGLTA